MKLTINKEEFLGHLTTASHFTSSKVSSISALQGVCLIGEKNTLHFYATNLSAYIHTSIKTPLEKDLKTVIDPKKIMEFLNLLPSSGKVDLEFTEKQLTVSSDKTTGSFPLVFFEDFPFPPKITQSLQIIKTSFLAKNLPLVTFASSGDESRATLTGVNFVTNEDLVMVATDGFRLSLIRTKKEIQLPPVIIPSEFLSEVLHFVKGEKEISFGYLEGEKIVVFVIGETELYSRVIDGDFPAYEKVIPTQKATTIKVDVSELARTVKIASVFAREFSSIITLSFKKTGLECRPKTDSPQENAAYCEIELEGEEQKVAFNFKFLLDFLAHTDEKKVIIEVLRSDAPVVFRLEEIPQFLHIIMPVRIQE